MKTTIEDKRIDICQARDRYGKPLYTKKQIAEMTDEQVEKEWEDLDINKAWLDAVRGAQLTPPALNTKEAIDTQKYHKMVDKAYGLTWKDTAIFFAGCALAALAVWIFSS